MSGTSLDGLDLAYCTFRNEQNNWKFKIEKTQTLAYNNHWKKQLRGSMVLQGDQLLELHHAYGLWLGVAAVDFIRKNDLKVDLIASHGHTVFHQPEKGVTFQLGEGQSLAAKSGRPVVSDFRTKDVVLGGQGAPLVPIGDDLLFNEYQACLNLGGIANISFSHDGLRRAFDISPANMLLNFLAAQSGYEYDREGEIAKSGEIDTTLLNALNALPYYNLPMPKSLGYEWFSHEVLPLIDSSMASTQDIMATAVAHEATQISRVINQYLESGDRVLVTGGGALNTFLVESIKGQLAPGIYLVIPEKQLINFKEAMVFAFMGLLRWQNKINCLHTVTGAKKDSSCGIVYLPG